MIPQILISYLIGSIPTAYILGKHLGTDVTKVGSRNIGTVNAWRLFGWKVGSFVLLFDALKGAIVMSYILATGLVDELAFYMALAVLLGNNFSIWLRFMGGKGIAVVFGLSLVLMPILTLVSILVIPIVTKLTKSLVYGLLAGITALNVLTITSNQPPVQVALCLTLSVIVIVTHLWRTRDTTLPALLHFNLRKLGGIE